jgi:hypothetical protein
VDIFYSVYCYDRVAQKKAGSDVTAAARLGRFDKAAIWRLIAVLVLLAFGFQSYVAQTHIHEAATATVFTGPAHHPVHSQSPVENSPLGCPFCQAVAHGGDVFIPDASPLFLMAQWVEITFPRFLLTDKSATAGHNWRSRAPPSL